MGSQFRRFWARFFQCSQRQCHWAGAALRRGSCNSTRGGYPLKVASRCSHLNFCLMDRKMLSSHSIYTYIFIYYYRYSLHTLMFEELPPTISRGSHFFMFPVSPCKRIDASFCFFLAHWGRRENGSMSDKLFGSPQDYETEGQNLERRPRILFALRAYENWLFAPFCRLYLHYMYSCIKLTDNIYITDN